ncbi:MAG: tetraacyldisaccharide 4'-kinase [Acidobacteria bacterium]|nr:tetraacyldisaccharide 4'-kinase [Acidobacteriota bacterium]
MNVLGGVYGRATALRRAWYGRHPDRARVLDRPVLSIGNLVVGGSGKTPVVAALARLLTAAGERPAVLSRGYGRRDAPDGVVVVSDGERVLAPPEQSGDEPTMLAYTLPGVPVLVARERYLAGRLAERRFACTVHLLDDGFQHLPLARDVDLLVVSAADLEDRLLPLGRLREPLEAARAADGLLVPGSEADVESVAGRTGVETAFRVTVSYGPLRLITDDPQGLAAHLQSGPLSRPVLGVAGIARPERFFGALRALGWTIGCELVFRDHHWFTPRDISRIEQAAFSAGATLIVTTEKDAARLSPALVVAPPAWAVLPIEAVVEPADQFASWLAGRLAAARRRRIEAAA